MNARDEIRKAVKMLFEPTDVVEVRAFGADGSKRVGRMHPSWGLVDAINAENEAGRDVYYVLNPTSLPPMSMSDGAMGTREEHVPRRRHFLLDFDPVRQHKIANEWQYGQALVLAEKVRKFLQQELNLAPLMASSGNGAHLLVPVDMPNDDGHKNQIKLFQKSISQFYSTPEVLIECFPDAARLVRAYGTINKKGEETADLKWRRSHIL